MTAPLYARVAVDVTRYSVDKPYSYRVPEPLASAVQPGVRVTVPFGRGNSRLEGIVLSVGETCTYEKTKPLDAVLDLEPVLSGDLLKLALWMRERFYCTVYDAVHAMLPSGMWYRNGKRRATDKTELFACLNVDGQEAMEAAEQRQHKAKQQAAVLRLLAVTGAASVQDIKEFTGAGMQSVRALEQQEYVTLEAREMFRSPGYALSPRLAPVCLTEEQQRTYDGICSCMEQGAGAALLYGVTGSGKTSVYIRLIGRVLESGRGAILLVPEISLTPQLVSIFSGHFGKNIAVLHSSLSMGERYDEWKRIRTGKVRLVIGTRSAVFAPVENLGLIVMDEEQEHTYQSENSPRYHAREVAKFRCVQAGAFLLLGSATPSVESMYYAKTGKYGLFTLTIRYNRQALPPVMTADMRREFRDGNCSTISNLLLKELEKNIEAGEQSILFLNRRGTASLVVCGECGYIHTCPNCSVSLTYHSSTRRLMCHHCGYMRRAETYCPECGGLLKYTGAGTQKVEEELRELLPGADIVRMDTDTVTAAKSHEALLQRFREKRIPILLGTQMVTKGLDFENVTLVGVLSADQSLYVNDYRAHERTFSLITQVVGRSGRGGKAGRAVIQTFTPQNEIIKLAAAQDYDGFYEREIALRQALLCPPFASFIAVTVTGMEEAEVLRGCVKLRDSLRQYLADREDVHVLGPAPAAVAKVNNRYRYRVTLSCKADKRVRDTVAHLITVFSGDKQYRALSVYAENDPMD